MIQLLTVISFLLAVSSSISQEIECDGFTRTSLDEPIVFTSPNFPEETPRFARCGMRVTVPAGVPVSIVCDPFSVTCRRSYLYVSLTGQSRQWVCGEQFVFDAEPSDVLRSLSLFFRARSRSSPGFRCTISTVPSCSGNNMTSTTASTSSTSSSSTSSSSTSSASSSQSSNTCLCGKKNTIDRIVGGRNVIEHEYPWQVALTGRNSNSVFCGGSLVSDMHIVTAAHCLRPGNLGFDVVLGEHNLRITNDGAIRLRPSSTIIHPNYNSFSNNNDIAIIVLASPVTFTREVRPICLPSGTPADNTVCEVTGWGRLSAGGSSPSILQTVSVPVIGRNQCNNFYPGSITQQMICAGLQQGGKDSCQGDSGGPMACPVGDNYELSGATSWGRGCAGANSPGVYANVFELRDFVNQHVSSGNTCPRS